MWRELVVSAVAGEERNPASGNRADTHRCGRCAERRVEGDVDGVLGEVVEARAAEHADLDAEIIGERVAWDVHERQSDELDVLDEELLDDVLDELELDELEFGELEFGELAGDDELFDDESGDELDSEPFESEVELELPDGVVADEPRLSVLKNPEPLKVTPTGWNTFFTGSTSPDSGWAYSVSVSSVNACWTSMVSPVSTNL